MGGDFPKGGNEGYSDKELAEFRDEGAKRREPASRELARDGKAQGGLIGAAKYHVGKKMHRAERHAMRKIGR